MGGNKFDWEKANKRPRNTFDYSQEIFNPHKESAIEGSSRPLTSKEHTILKNKNKIKNKIKAELVLLEADKKLHSSKGLLLQDIVQVTQAIARRRDDIKILWEKIVELERELFREMNINNGNITHE